MKATIGIDPGITGAIALIEDGKVIEVEDMPIMAKSSGKGNQVNAVRLSAIIEGFMFSREIWVNIEAVNAMPGQGVTSQFSLGKSAGIIEGVVAALALPYSMISPQKWKRKEGLIGKEKDAARALCIREHPEIADKLTRKKDGGRADAILIARQ